MVRSISIAFVLTLSCLQPAWVAAEPLPFHHKVEVYREKDVAVFTF